MKHILVFTFFLALFSCQKKTEYQASSMFQKEKPNTSAVYDLDQIQESGILVAGTVYGPETYYEYHGYGLGIQYLLADAFSREIGARLQVQVAKDTTELIDMLSDGEIDFIAVDIKPVKGFLSLRHFGDKGWLMRNDTPLLAQEMQKWWSPSRPSEVMARFTRRVKSETHRSPRPKWRNRARGIISDYDDIFRRNATRIDWDWKLIAAQCYQESSFDPNAKSWAGASGLMQIMPQTASSLGLPMSQIMNPEANIQAAVKYLGQLERMFSDITDRQERIKFCLASYNGGPHHIKDAQALTSKYGGDPHRWNDVAQYVINLQYSRFYRDPVVKYGYMRGSETESYVRRIQSYYNEYR